MSLMKDAFCDGDLNRKKLNKTLNRRVHTIVSAEGTTT